jgi:putative ABC transport system permease protein
LAVLKAIGYSDKFALWLVLAEGLVIALLGGLVGLLLASLILPKLSQAMAGMLPPLSMKPADFAVGLFFAIAAGIASTIFPATAAMRLRVVDAIRRV